MQRNIFIVSECMLLMAMIAHAGNTTQPVSLPWLGIIVRNYASTDNPKVGAVVDSVELDSPAAKIGVAVGDIITTWNGKKVSSKADFDRDIAASVVSKRYTLGVVRNLNGKWKFSERAVVVVAKVAEVVAAENAGPSKWKEWDAEQVKIDPDHRPYELKGDRLGMTLQMFKQKYFRKMPHDPRPAPFCSDQDPNDDISTLLYKAEYARAGIVHASTTFLYEANEIPPNVPTIAVAPADLFVYKFVDDQLYEITVFFRHSDFGQVMDALKAKYGEPNAKDTRAYQNAFGAKFDGDVLLWKNVVSEISVFERAGDLDRSLLVVSHKELAKAAIDHIKSKIKPRTDDL